MKYLLVAVMLAALTACNDDDTSDERVNYCDLAIQAQARASGFDSVQEYYDAQSPKWQGVMHYLDGCVE